jgi:DNA-binding CsgD family transcriptional regulator
VPPARQGASQSSSSLARRPGRGEDAQIMDLPVLPGRDAEQATLRRTIAEARLGSSGALVLTGDPGIGKTALLDWTIGVARSEGMEVIAGRGVESEAEVPFGGLLELVRPILDQIGRIPAAQAEALRGALDLGPTWEGDRFLIGAATLNLLSARSETAPLVVVVDDAHWLDDSSLAAVLFASRRLLVDRVAVLFATRTGEAPALSAARLPELRLGGVGVDAAVEILARHAPEAPPRDVVQHLARATGGNPLALVELARGGAAQQASAEGPLEVQTSVAAAFSGRITSLPPRARQALALAAAEGSGRVAWIGSAAPVVGLELDDLEPGERAGLVSISFGTLSWQHPLARSAAYGAVEPAARRAMHAALAEVLPEGEPDRRAWHRAAAALGPDEAAAAELVGAGARARARSAYASAAAALERAAGLSPSDETRARRLFAAAEAAWLGGDAHRAEGDLGRAGPIAPDLGLRAEIEHLRGQLVVRGGDVMAGHEILLEGARLIEAADPGKAAVMLAEATDACVYAGRADAMLEPARRARDLLPSDAGDRERFFASIALGTALIYAGEGQDGARLLREAITILEGSDVLSTDPRSLSEAALAPLWLREADVGGSLIERAVEVARREGALGVLPFALTLAAREAATGSRWAVGRALYEEAIGLSRETEQAMPLAGALAGLAGLLARAGDAPGSRAAAEEALAISDRLGLGLYRVWTLDALAVLELGLGRPEEAAERLEELASTLRALGLSDPDLSPLPELVEARVRAGVGGELAPEIELFAAAAQAKGQPWSLARLGRARGLIADPRECSPGFEDAIQLHGATPDRFEEARTRLCFGECLRRGGERIAAREQLRAALEAFEDLGAKPWADRAGAEMLATGERARRRDPSTLDDLTPQELQIGLLLAAGHTTKEAAAKLFLSPKTIEYHLRNVYRKLAIHSRKELAISLSPLGPGSGVAVERRLG